MKEVDKIEIKKEIDSSTGFNLVFVLILSIIITIGFGVCFSQVLENQEKIIGQNQQIIELLNVGE